MASNYDLPEIQRISAFAAELGLEWESSGYQDDGTYVVILKLGENSYEGRGDTHPAAHDAAVDKAIAAHGGGDL